MEGFSAERAFRWEGFWPFTTEWTFTCIFGESPCSRDTPAATKAKSVDGEEIRLPVVHEFPVAYCVAVANFDVIGEPLYPKVPE